MNRHLLDQIVHVLKAELGRLQGFGPSAPEELLEAMLCLVSEDHTHARPEVLQTLLDMLA